MRRSWSTSDSLDRLPAQQTIADAEAAAARILAEAERDAAEAVAAAPRRADAFADARIRRLRELTDRLVVTAETVERRFGEELRTLASELVAAYDRVLAHERALARTRHRIVLEAQTDVHALAALEKALRASAHVHAVQLRAYAGGQASLVVDVG